MYPLKNDNYDKVADFVSFGNIINGIPVDVYLDGYRNETSIKYFNSLQSIKQRAKRHDDMTAMMKILDALVKVSRNYTPVKEDTKISVDCTV